METLERILPEHPFFREFHEDELELMAGCASNARFAEGEMLFRAGEPADTFFLVREGNVALDVAAPGQEPIIIQTVGPGEVLGWSWLIPPHSRQFSGRAVGPVRAFVMDGACLRRKCEEDPKLGYRLIMRFARIMAERVQSMQRQLIEVYDAYRLIVEGR